MDLIARCVPLALLAGVACVSPETPRQATVYFHIDAPLCSMNLKAQFFVDSVHVGTDTFRVQIPPEHLTTRGFALTPGAHVLGAMVVLGAAPTPWPDTPDTAVMVAAGDTITRVLPFYCS